MKLRDITALIEDEYTTIQGGPHSVESVDSVTGDAEATQLVGDDIVSLDQDDCGENVESVGPGKNTNIVPPVTANAALSLAVPVTLSTKSRESRAGSDSSLGETPVAVGVSTGGADKAGHLAELVLGQISHLGLTPMSFSRVRGLAGEIVSGQHIDVLYLELVRSLKTGNNAAVDLGAQFEDLWPAADWITITNWEERASNRRKDDETETKEGNL